MGECQLTFARHGQTVGMRSLLDLLLDPGASFLLSPADYFGPSGDPFGAVLDTSLITIDGVASNNRDLTLAGFPAGYSLHADDLLSFTYGSNPVRYAFHRVVFDTSVASGGLITCEVWPRIRPGWSVGAKVELKKPRFKAIMSDREAGASARVFHSGMSFSFVQTLR